MTDTAVLAKWRSKFLRFYFTAAAAHISIDELYGDIAVIIQFDATEVWLYAKIIQDILAQFLNGDPLRRFHASFLQQFPPERRGRVTFLTPRVDLQVSLPITERNPHRPRAL